MESKPTITVIVPIFNTEKYLDICIDSIEKQTYPNLELLLVDDGATDESGVLCDQRALEDPGICVIHKPNGGQGQARNLGIALSDGAYIGFVDSDDFIEPKMYERLCHLLEEHDAQVAGCDYIRFSAFPFAGFSDGEGEINDFTAKEAIADLIACRHFDSTVCNLLVQSNLAKEVVFDEGKLHEDVLWPYRVLRRTERAVHTTQQLYAYYQRPGSTMHSAFSEKRFDGLDALQQRAQEIKVDFPDLFPAAEKAYAGSCFYNYQYLCRAGKTEEYSHYKAVLHKRFLAVDRDVIRSCLNQKYKFWYALFARMPKLTCHIRNRLGIGL